MAKIVTVLEGIPNRRKERRKEGKTCGLTKCLLGGVSKHLQPTYISSIRQGSLLLHLQCSGLSFTFSLPSKKHYLYNLSSKIFWVGLNFLDMFDAAHKNEKLAGPVDGMASI